LEGLASLAVNVAAANPSVPLEHPKLNATLLKATHDTDSQVRSTAAFASGVLGGMELLERLRTMLNDESTTVRYNAATGLARYGDAAAQGQLVEMLDPKKSAAAGLEGQDAAPRSEIMVTMNALRAAKLLSENNPTADLQPLERAIEKVLRTDIDQQTRIEATEAQEALHARTGSSAIQN
jgi:hypothetical protein